MYVSLRALAFAPVFTNSFFAESYFTVPFAGNDQRPAGENTWPTGSHSTKTS